MRQSAGGKASALFVLLAINVLYCSGNDIAKHRHSGQAKHTAAVGQHTLDSHNYRTTNTFSTVPSHALTTVAAATHGTKQETRDQHDSDGKSDKAGEEVRERMAKEEAAAAAAAAAAADPYDDIVQEFLSQVADMEANKANCTPGVTSSLGEGIIAQYGLQRYRAQAMLAVNRANLLTRLWKFAAASASNYNNDRDLDPIERRQSGKTPGWRQMNETEWPEEELVEWGGVGPVKDLLNSEYFLYSQVRSMIESDPNVFGAGNCYDAYEYKNYSLFCAYGYRSDPSDPRVVTVKDLSVGYHFLGNDSEFFYLPRTKANKKLQNYYNQIVGYSMFRLNDSVHLPPIRETTIDILYDDGHWSKPYFDCKGGDIWMMTYTVGFFGYRNNSYYFKGTSGIDIDLQRVDIDQCPLPADKADELNVFAGSAKCKRDTTKCVPILGLGFRRGSYRCVCLPGYYFPDTMLAESQRFYNGSEIEHQYELRMRGLPNHYDTSFGCLQCAPGCRTCQDDQPCLVALNWPLRSLILAAACIIISFVPLVFWFTINFQDVKVLKAASPMILRIILWGALMLYCPMVIQYFEPTEITCCLRLWLRELGFAVSYGALLLKTWRISVVFRVKSAQRIKISDASLIKRLLLLVLLFTIFLSLRTVFARPRVVEGSHSSGRIAFQCSWDTWDYCGAIAELCLLLWGIRLCIVVRKAPSEFNESRFISWAIYNETLLSLFLNITMYFLQSTFNPDLLYVVLFLHTQLTTTVTLAFLFGSKAYLVYKYRGCSDQLPGSNTAVQSMVRSSMSFARTRQASNVTIVRSTSAEPSSLVKPDNCEELPKDICDELQRLYAQIEMLKLRNMKAGNPHMTSGSRLSPVALEPATLPAATAATKADNNGCASLPHHNEQDMPLMDHTAIGVHEGDRERATFLMGGTQL